MLWNHFADAAPVRSNRQIEIREDVAQFKPVGLFERLFEQGPRDVETDVI